MKWAVGKSWNMLVFHSLVTYILILVSLSFSKLHTALCCARNVPFVIMVTYMCIKLSVCIGLFFIVSSCGDISGGGELMAHARVREQIYRVSSPLHGFWESNSGCQAYIYGKYLYPLIPLASFRCEIFF